MVTSTWLATGMAWPKRMHGAAESGGGGGGLRGKEILSIMHHTPSEPGTRGPGDHVGAATLLSHMLPLLLMETSEYANESHLTLQLPAHNVAFL